METMNLPTRAFIQTEFGVFDHNNQCCPEIEPSSGKIQCGCPKCARWKMFLQGRLTSICPCVQYEVFTREFVEELARYLLERAAFFSLPVLRVLEVGAGNGRLSFNLKKSISEQSTLLQKIFRIEIVATDLTNSTHTLSDDSTQPIQTQESDNAAPSQGGIPEEGFGASPMDAPSTENFTVRIQDAESAIKGMQPDLVIASWMPMGLDWTTCMRDTPSIREYILIGETDDGICGHPLRTWGCSFTDDEEEDDEEEEEDDDQEEEKEGSRVDCEDVGSPCMEASTSASADSTLKAHEKENPLDLLLVGSPSSRDCVVRVRVPPGRLQRMLGSRRAWQRVELIKLSRIQVGRTDELWMLRSRSHTVSFRRLDERSAK